MLHEVQRSFGLLPGAFEIWLCKRHWKDGSLRGQLKSHVVSVVPVPMQQPTSSTPSSSCEQRATDLPGPAGSAQRAAEHDDDQRDEMSDSSNNDADSKSSDSSSSS